MAGSSLQTFPVYRLGTKLYFDLWCVIIQDDSGCIKLVLNLAGSSHQTARSKRSVMSSQSSKILEKKCIAIVHFELSFIHRKISDNISINKISFSNYFKY
jgi:hypothetical protein